MIFISNSTLNPIISSAIAMIILYYLLNTWPTCEQGEISILPPHIQAFKLSSMFSPPQISIPTNEYETVVDIHVSSLKYKIRKDIFCCGCLSRKTWTMVPVGTILYTVRQQLIATILRPKTRAINYCLAINYCCWAINYILRKIRISLEYII